MSIRRAVLLEDDDVDASAILKSLRKLGFETRRVNTPQDIEAHIGAELFIIDIKLDGESGLTVINKLRMRAPDAFIVVYSHYADRPEYNLAAEEKQPDMLLLKGDWDQDILTMVVGCNLRRLESLECEQTALIFLTARFGLYTFIWAAGLLAITLGALPWLDLFRWSVIWTIISLSLWTLWTASAGERIERVSKAKLFHKLLGAKKGLTALLGAAVLHLIVDLLKNGTHRPR